LDLLAAGYDWVLALSADTWIRTPELNFNGLLSRLNVTQEMIDNGKSMFFLESDTQSPSLWPPHPEGHNSGNGVATAEIIFIKNTKSSEAVLQRWWEININDLPTADYQDQSCLWSMLGLDESKRPRTWSKPKDPLSKHVMVVPEVALSPHQCANAMNPSAACVNLAHVCGVFAPSRLSKSFEELHTTYSSPFPFPSKENETRALLKQAFFSDTWQTSDLWYQLYAAKMGHPRPLGRSCAPRYQLNNKTY
jgi:hypothetical protein